jgi:diaminohydroxyphosphoribosylaminopyrimidine deaminase/5-amino-6-(5-phosphoribosylamino)uracil reductase
MNSEQLMLRAISLADPYKYKTKPNPVVGCLILKDDLVISDGAHEEFGSDHAEVNAIKKAKIKMGTMFDTFEELTLICTLEPCNHLGKTGPCSEAIIQSGIKKVIIGCMDPNPMVSGKGIEKLIENGINVEVGFCEELIQEQNKFFFFRHQNKKPFITLKIASSKDGKSYNKDGGRTLITCKESREDVQLIRAMHDAILTGGNTVLNDNPKMNARVGFPVNQPKKILLTSKENLNNNFFKDTEVLIIKETDIHAIIEDLKNLNINSILVEAGPKLANSFLLAGLVDELIIYESPNDLGSNGVNWFEEDKAVENFGFKLESLYKIEADTKKIYRKC